MPERRYPFYTDGKEQVQNKFNPDSRIDIYLDPENLALLYVFQNSWSINDVSGAFQLTDEVREERTENGQADFKRTMLDLTDAKWHANGVSQAERMASERREKKKLLPMYVMGGDRYFRMLLKTVSFLTSSVVLVENYQEYLKLIEESRKG